MTDVKNLEQAQQIETLRKVNSEQLTRLVEMDLLRKRIAELEDTNELHKVIKSLRGHLHERGTQIEKLEKELKGLKDTIQKLSPAQP